MTRRLLPAVLAVLVALPGPLRADVPPADPELARGIEEVKAGQHDAGIETLQSVVRRAYGDPAQKALLVEAYVQLAVARLAMGDRDGARGELDAALEHDPKLRLSPPRYPAEVISVLEDVRRQRQESGRTVRAVERRKKLGKAVLVVGAAAGAVAGGLALKDASRTDPIPIAVVDVQYEATTVICPDGAQGLELPFAFVVFTRTTEDVEVSGAQVIPLFVGGTIPAPGSNAQAPRPGVVTSLNRLVANQPGLVRIESTITCTNPFGNSATFQTWRIQGQLVTSAGRIGFQAPAGRILRLDLP